MANWPSGQHVFGTWEKTGAVGESHRETLQTPHKQHQRSGSSREAAALPTVPLHHTFIVWAKYCEKGSGWWEWKREHGGLKWTALFVAHVQVSPASFVSLHNFTFSNTSVTRPGSSLCNRTYRIHQFSSFMYFLSAGEWEEVSPRRWRNADCCDRWQDRKSGG